MSDLISRQSVIDVLKETGIRQDNDLGHLVVDEISRIPTAYDIDKVVSELEADSSVKLYGSGNSDNYLIPVKRAIEIVKQGGVADDVCEWESVSDGEFIQNPHTRRTFSNEPSMQNVYCNTCGKKIKIVGD